MIHRTYERMNGRVSIWLLFVAVLTLDDVRRIGQCRSFMLVFALGAIRGALILAKRVEFRKLDRTLQMVALFNPACSQYKRIARISFFLRVIQLNLNVWWCQFDMFGISFCVISEHTARWSITQRTHVSLQTSEESDLFSSGIATLERAVKRWCT